MNKLIISIITLSLFQSADAQDYEALRLDMVRKQLAPRGIEDKATLETMQKVERHLFVPSEQQKKAYHDTPLPIGYGQTISQPFMVAMMTQVLDPKPDDRVLEIGAGSGYQAAVLAEIVKEVYSIEIVPELGKKTQQLLSSLGYDNAEIIIGDGYHGLESKAPFDAIMVTAAPEEIPQALIDQLKDGGRMVIPVGGIHEVQTLMLIEKKNGEIIKTNLSAVRFVPFTREKP